MKQSEVEDFFRDDVSHFWGLINVDKIAGISGLQSVYTFLHLTFQEYLAAYLLSKLSMKEQIEVIDKYGKKDQMRVVWKFFCGLVDDLSPFQKLASAQSKENDLFMIKCSSTIDYM